MKAQMPPFFWPRRRVQRQRGLARGFRPVDLDHAAARQAADAERDVEPERAGRDGLDGADVIAQIHDSTTIRPFLDHELFHLYHDKYFSGCDDVVWCALWTEGLAVYVASKMEPAADDRALLLTLPRPIRPEVEPRLDQAMCMARAKLDSSDQADYATFFQGMDSDAPFPPRFGYLLGYLLVQKIAAGRTLDQLAKLPRAQVRPLLDAALAEYDCAAVGSPGPSAP
jgi:hypothetical protein